MTRAYYHRMQLHHDTNRQLSYIWFGLVLAAVVRILHSFLTAVEVSTFVFASRRRHTSSLCDWSSDVCSSDLLRFWQRWVTPVFAPRRYDTRFFVAVMPSGQTPLHDDVETTDSTWVRPADAIARGRSGELVIIFPTRKTLESLEGLETTTSVFDAAGARPTSPILPRLVME